MRLFKAGMVVAVMMLGAYVPEASAKDESGEVEQGQSASSDCSEGPDSQMIGCAVDLYKANDSELNVVYGKVLKQLTPDQRKALVTLERKWVKERDAECVEGLGPSKDDPNANFGMSHMLTSYQQNMCLATRTRQRIEWLRTYPLILGGQAVKN